LVHWRLVPWALQYHIKASFKCASKIPTARKDLLGPCCNICWAPHSKERTDEVEPDHEQAFHCSTCIHTYHWDCLIIKLVVNITINPGGSGPTLTINRAELAAVLVAVQIGQTEIATDSASSLFQIGKQLLNPMAVLHHLHTDYSRTLLF